MPRYKKMVNYTSIVIEYLQGQEYEHTQALWGLLRLWGHLPYFLLFD